MDDGLHVPPSLGDQVLHVSTMPKLFSSKGTNSWPEKCRENPTLVTFGQSLTSIV